jgi:hypothetical protein
MKRFIPIALLVFSIQTSSALEFNSGESKVRLIELYTSQSCSSCPPAETWLSNLKNSDKLWTEFIPISFHVSYWNHLSWKDSFSKQEFSNRQREYHRVIRGGVYTPQVVLDGKDFRKWRNINANSFSKSRIKPGNLNVSIDKDLKTAKLSFNYKKKSEGLICYGAYIEGGHSSKITSGENEGKKIRQDFIVIDLVNKMAKKNKRKFTCSLDLKVRKNQKESGLVFWLINKKTYEVVQVAGGKL